VPKRGIILLSSTKQRVGLALLMILKDPLSEEKKGKDVRKQKRKRKEKIYLW